MKINVDFMRRWVAAVGRHVGDETGADDVIPDDADSWADVLAVLKHENTPFYMECQKRLRIPQTQVEAAFNARYAA